MSTIEQQIRAIADEAFAQTEPVLPAPRIAEPQVVTAVDPVDLDARRHMRNRTRLLTVAATVLVVALVGGLLIATNRSADPTPVDESNGRSITESLRRLPADAATFGDLRIAGADFVALEALTGIERPAALDDSDAWLALTMEDLGSDPAYFGVVVPRSELFFEGLLDPEGFRDELPFSPFDVGQFVTVEMGGGLTRTFDEFTLVGGVDAVREAVDDDGYLKIGSGELGERNLASRTPLRPLGQPMQVGFDAEIDTVAVDRGVDFVPRWLNGTTDSLLAASPDLAAVAEQLDRIDGLASFALSVEDFSFDPTLYDAAGLDEMIIIDRPFSVLATGWSGIGESARVVYVYGFTDEQAAADAAPSIEAVFAPDNVVATPLGEETLTMRSILDVESIETVGRTVVVTASPQRTDAGFLPPYLFHD